MEKKLNEEKRNLTIGVKVLKNIKGLGKVLSIQC